METSQRPGKGDEVFGLPEDYTAIDLELTGLSFEHDQIIEIGALRVQDGKPAQEFSTLVRPSLPIPEKVTALTGITNAMTADAPAFCEIAGVLRDFLGEGLLLGHSVDFDLTFLYDAFWEAGQPPLSNPWLDTFPLSQKILPELPRHRLSDVASYYTIDASHAHRALADCRINCKVMGALSRTARRAFPEAFRPDASTGSLDISQLPKRLKSRDIAPNPQKLPIPPEDQGALYGKHIVITGILKRITRREAMQYIADCGGYNEDKVNTSTDLLICGSPLTPSAAATSKYRKALRLKNEGQAVEILDEQQFLALSKLYEI